MGDEGQQHLWDDQDQEQGWAHSGPLSQALHCSCVVQCLAVLKGLRCCLPLGPGGDGM